MEAAVSSRGASARRILWESIAKVSEGAPSSCSEASRFFEETEGNHCRVNHLLDFRDHELEPTTRPVQCSRIIVAPSMTSAPNIIADMVTIAEWKAWPQHLVFHTCRGGNDCNGGNAETIVGSNGLLSASVNASSRCLHVRLQGMKSNYRYFVSIGVQLYGQTSDPDRDIASDVVPQPNLLDGFGWVNTPLCLDLTVLLEENPWVPVCTTAKAYVDVRYKITMRILLLSEDCWPAGVKPVLITLKEGFLVEILSTRQQTVNRPGVFPFGTQDVTSLSDHQAVSGVSFGPYSFSSPVIESHGGYPWQEEDSMPVTLGLDLPRGVMQEPAALFRFRETSQSPPFMNFVSNGFLSPATPGNDYIAADRGRTNFFRDLDGEALLRQLHLRQRRPSTMLPVDSHSQQCCGSPCDERHHAMPDDVDIFQENLFDGGYACPSADATFFL
ncbi:uncharacterized protein LOC119393713 isoform X2 [Rhipicephalus sanguineus]|uniref:uncharacterized protein LOC119393713 isoform X2 n=1 Tax=Rhipicephalus sanguineus TaxID=34632 RepID=UPI0020C1EA18|nr:uncharacterized protein LOC119393713 isoform X2 [Rhipicephalus sanguineus]